MDCYIDLFTKGIGNHINFIFGDKPPGGIILSALVTIVVCSLAEALEHRSKKQLLIDQEIENFLK